jgi:nitroreductase
MTVHSTKEFQVTEHRKTDHPVDPLFVNRWSPRAFDGSQMTEADLKTILEAARWAPSAYNVQPWRFVYSLRGDDSWPGFPKLLNEFNRSWAENASALVIVLSDTLMPEEIGGEASGFNSFDTGAAWAQLALQASAMGYATHAMAGILPERIRTALAIPDRYKIEIAVAIGRRADSDVLPEGLRDRELPSPRRPLAETAFKGLFEDR